MKKYTVTGYTRNNKAAEPVLTYNTEAFTDKMMQDAMYRIQMFNCATLRFEVKEVSL